MTHSILQDTSKSSEKWSVFNMRQCRMCGGMFAPEKLCMIEVPGENPYFVCENCTVPFEKMFGGKKE